MQIKRVALVLASAAFVASAALVYQSLFVFRIDHIKAPRSGDRQYAVARSALDQEYPDYVKLFQGNISSLKINGNKLTCYFFYKKSSMIYEDNDFIYCFDKASGNFLGRM
jgi:hypothetical protein